jgi:hypothetical protein
MARPKLLQTTLLLTTLIMSWLGMQAVHELGHVLGALASGGEVRRVVLHPLTISRTDLGANPQPLFVVWAGSLLGVALPLLCWFIAARWRSAGAFLWRFFAGFCLIANGAYIGLGSFDRVGDCGEMLRQGSSLWQLWLFGMVTIPLGFWFWHGQARHFGLGEKRNMIDARTVGITTAIAVALIVLGLITGG